MKVALVTRSTLFSARGGDTIQVEATTRQLQELGIDASIVLTNELKDTGQYDLLHFFNITRPADILSHTLRSKTPYVVTPIWIDYAEYDRYYRGGLPGRLFKQLQPGQIEYFKAIARWIKGNDKNPGSAYLKMGHRKSIQIILERASALLVNSTEEYDVIWQHYSTLPPCCVVTSGIDNNVFKPVPASLKNKRLVICAARIEGIKNQLQLIRALNNTDYEVLLIGDPAPNQRDYYHKCRRAAATNIQFIPQVSQSQLLDYYEQAVVHVLPSWYESCGLASLEAAAMGCQVVATRKGFAASFLGDDAFYCEPSSAYSIRHAVERAVAAEPPLRLQQRILENNTWQNAARQTSIAYQKIIADQCN